MIEFLVLLLAGSVDNLQNETGDRAELTGYLGSHNITLNPSFNLNNMTMYELETIVQGHIDDCKSGSHDSMIESLRNDKSLDFNTRKDMIGLYGNC